MEGKKKITRKELKEKQHKTLEKMKKTRKKDSIFLRITMEEKLKWAIAEFEKGKSVISSNLNTIEICKQRIEETKNTILKLQGAITVLKNILEPKEEPKKEE